MPYLMCSHDESQRLSELERLNALELTSPKSYGNYTRLAASLCAAPAAAISLVDLQQQWLKAPFGLQAMSIPRAASFCSQVMAQKDTLIINGLDAYAAFRGNPLIQAEPAFRFYIGVPLMTRRGFCVGTLCVLDRIERSLSQQQIEALQMLAAQIVVQLEESSSRQPSDVTLSRLSTLLDHMDFAALIEDEGRKALYCNNVFRSLFPMASMPSGNSGPSWMQDIQAYFRQPEAFAQLVQSLVAMQRKHLGTELHTVDGRTLELDYVPSIQDDRYLGHIWIFRDKTRQLHSLEQLEQRKIQVVQAEKMAVLGEMAAGLAHEINNPLAIIQAQAHCLRLLFRRNAMSAELMENTVRSIEATSNRIAKIIQGLRAFARDDGQAPAQSVKVQQIIDDALMFCESRIKNHGFRLSVLPFSSDLTVSCRPVQITQVLVNLLNNALDACKSQASRDQWIEVQVMADDHEVTLHVVDSGPGIPRELSDRIVLPFFTTKEIGKGQGMGLSIAKGIVESHQGRFYLDQQALHTTFVMKLPATASQLAPN